MGYYNTLSAETGYLSNVRLKLSQASGITANDLAAAQAHARATIDAALGGIFDASAWENATPPVIERIADMLSSAEVLLYKYERGDTAGGGDSALPAVLARDAGALLEMIRRGAIDVVTAGGEVQPRFAAALPAARVAGTTFFPDASGSLGGSRGLDALYRERGA